MTESRFLDPEDEAFNDIERQAKQRKESVRVATKRKTYEQGLIDGQQVAGHDGAIFAVRNSTIEEVAQHIEKLTGFGADTVSGLAIYIREMKK